MDDEAHGYALSPCVYSVILVAWGDHRPTRAASLINLLDLLTIKPKHDFGLYIEIIVFILAYQ